MIPSPPRDVADLEDRLSAPTEAVVDLFRSLGGDVLFLGVGGKMGPTLARMAARAAAAAGGPPRKLIGVSRFRDGATRAALEAAGVETIGCDLLGEGIVENLPEAPNVVFMTGMKFGAGADAARTWAMNCHLPSLVARRFRRSRIVAFSTGNVYPYFPAPGPGPSEETPLAPVGEYGMSALGRERMFAYFAGQYGFPLSLLRLNYAIDLRYGVLHDLARQVADGEPIDLTTGYVNVLWQGDANRMALLALGHARGGEPLVANLAGPECLSVRAAATRFGELLGTQPQFVGVEAPDALLSDGRRGHVLFGPPTVDVETLIAWQADWIARGLESLGKPTKFQVRSGSF